MQHISTWTRRAEVEYLVSRIRSARDRIADLAFEIECEEDSDVRQRIRATRDVALGAFDVSLDRLAAMANGSESPIVSRPVKSCGFVIREDGSCGHPSNITPECHEHVCPLLMTPTAPT